MSKVYMEATIRLIVETDLQNPCNIIDSLDITAIPSDENVEVYDCEVLEVQITDAK